MLNIDEIQNGIVIDHIKAGTAIGLMDLLGIKGNRTSSVALIQNARSQSCSNNCSPEMLLSPADLKKSEFGTSSLTARQNLSTSCLSESGTS